MEWYVFIVVTSILLGGLLVYRKKSVDIEHSYQGHFFGSSRPMFIYAPETWQIADVNDATVSCYGYSRVEFRQMTLRDIILAGDIDRLQPSLQGSSEDTTNKNTGIHKKKNGDTLYANVISRSLRWKGRWLRVAIINNVTELVTAKEKIQEVNSRLSETLQRYDTLTEATHEAVWECDLENAVVLWNRGIKTIFGYTDVPKEADFWTSKIYVDDLAEVNASLSLAFQNKETTWAKSYRFCCANGDSKHVENRAVIIYNKEDKPVKIIGSMQDVELRHQLEKEVVTLSMIAQVSSNAILIMDKDGCIEWVNESFVNMSGFTLHEAKGRKMQELLQNDETNDINKNETEEFTQAKKSFSTEVINYRKDGSRYWATVHFSPIVINGKLQNTIAIQNDITELKEREEKITEQNRRLKEVAFATSHIIRAPVANVIGLSNLLAMSNSLQEEDKEVVTHLLDATDKLDALIRNIARRSEMI